MSSFRPRAVIFVVISMANRCLGIICSYLVGYTSTHFESVVRYPPPWTILDAQVYLGAHGIGLGLCLDDVPKEGDQVEIPPHLFDMSIGLARVKTDHTWTISRHGVTTTSPVIHAMLYKRGQWYDPRADETIQPANPPAELMQLWPVYKVQPPQGVQNGNNHG